jgi:hypothetical protein
MKRSFSPPALVGRRRVLVAGALLCGAVACAPNNNVKPGAPQLTEFNIVQAQQPTPSGFGTTKITPDTPECATSIVGGEDCLPEGKMADAADGGSVTKDIPADTVCRQTSAMNWCTCVTTDAMLDPTKGTWQCPKFANVVSVIAVFDRLLDTAPLDPGDAAGLTDVMMISASAGAPSFDILTDYSSTGAANGIVFNDLGPLYFANFRGDGPSLLSAPQPAFPSGTTLTVMLNGDKVRAKDGTTPFMGANLLMGGTMVFTMAPFAANVATPAPPDPMSMVDPTTVPGSVLFTSFVDPMEAGKQITITTASGPVLVTIESSDGGATYVITPSTGWPKGEAVTIKVDATTKNLLGQTITAPATGTFTVQ